MTARSDGSTSPCATTTALMGKRKTAPERRSQGIPRVSTPYADITQIRFWGLRLSALSAPHSSGAHPSYEVVGLQPTPLLDGSLAAGEYPRDERRRLTEWIAR